MQDCFRQHPEIYGAELEDDDEPQPQSDAPPSEAPATPEAPSTAAELDASSHPTEKQTRAKDVNTQVKTETVAAGDNVEGDTLVPKAELDVEEKEQARKA